MSKEIDFLDEFLASDDDLWKGKYRIRYRDHCEVVVIKCPHCKTSTCSPSSCPEYHEDQVEFNKLKTSVYNYLTKEERKISANSANMQKSFSSKN